MPTTPHYKFPYPAMTDSVARGAAAIRDLAMSVESMLVSGEAKGPKGDRGPAGPRGAQGPSGQTGPAGPVASTTSVSLLNVIDKKIASAAEMTLFRWGNVRQLAIRDLQATKQGLIGAIPAESRPRTMVYATLAGYRAVQAVVMVRPDGGIYIQDPPQSALSGSIMWIV